MLFQLLFKSFKSPTTGADVRIPNALWNIVSALAKASSVQRSVHATTVRIHLLKMQAAPEPPEISKPPLKKGSLLARNWNESVKVDFSILNEYI